MVVSLRQQSTPTSRLSQAWLILWGVSSVALGAGLVWNDTVVQIIGAVLGTSYVLSLIVGLFRSKPDAADLPASDPLVTFLPNYVAMLCFVLSLTVIATLLTSILCQDGWLMLLLSIPLSFVIVIIWRKRLNRRQVIAGAVMATVLAIVEPLLGEEQSSGLIIPLSAAVMFLAGALLLDHTGLTHSRFLEGDYREAGISFLWGCVLAVPPALLNLLSLRLTPPSTFDLLYDRWWEIFYAFQPGILEEIWARLLLTTLLYALLRPTCTEHPQRALIGAMGIAAFIHGMAHYPGSITTLWEGVYIALMYGIPLALLYVKRDLEQAVAYHFFIDLIRFAAFVIWNTSV